MPLPKNSQILDESTSKSAPTTAADGVQIPQGTLTADVFLKSTAGSGTMTALVRLWGYDPNYDNKTGGWFPLSTGTGEAAANKAGVLNGGSAIEEISADQLCHYEVVQNLESFSRLDAEIITLGGTATAIDLFISWHTAFRRGT